MRNEPLPANGGGEAQGTDLRLAAQWLIGDDLLLFAPAAGGQVGDQTILGSDDMANPVPAGGEVSSGTCKCTSCGYELDVSSTKHLPPCRSCANGEYDAVSAADSVNDRYPI